MSSVFRVICVSDFYEFFVLRQNEEKTYDNKLGNLFAASTQTSNSMVKCAFIF